MLILPGDMRPQLTASQSALFMISTNNVVYSVDVLGEPEKISSKEELDVKRYGVIVTRGYKRGLLLPNLEGVDTVEEQISIARRKAGIREHEEVQMERFEVVRHF